jgi:phosphoribosylformylglycinamidine synthase subunit PurQ / glutaminase
MKPRVLILRAAGTNCDLETAHAFELSGCVADRVHLNRVIEAPDTLDSYQMLAIPGGFSYGDDLSAGRIFANQLTLRLGEALHKFVDRKKPVIGICNGFQVLVKTSLLPGPIPGAAEQQCTLTDNDSRRFMAQWVGLEAPAGKCVWTRGLGRFELPIAHGEGKLLCASDAVRTHLHAHGQVALTYTGENPNGSTDLIAGICDASGLVLGLMPHPERFVSMMQYYDRPAGFDPDAAGAGLALFNNAAALFR